MAHRKLYVNLPVRDVKRSIEFFAKLGFEFDPQFASENGACLVINADSSVMLVTEALFKTFSNREICNTRTHNEALCTVSCESRAEVDGLVKLAGENGGKPSGEPQDHGFMYDWGFFDPDGHGWGVLCMTPGAAAGDRG